MLFLFCLSHFYFHHITQGLEGFLTGTWRGPFRWYVRGSAFTLQNAQFNSVHINSIQLPTVLKSFYLFICVYYAASLMTEEEQICQMKEHYKRLPQKASDELEIPKEHVHVTDSSLGQSKKW